MSWQTKGRVDIYGQGGPCDRSRVEVSHAFPAMLAGYVPPEDWEAFCVKLDQTLEPAQAIKLLQFKMMILAIVVSVMAFIWAAVAMSKDVSDWDSDNFWIFLIIMGAVMLFVPLFLVLKMKKVTFEVRNAMKRVCDEESNKYPLMTFQIRFESTVVGGSCGVGGDAQVRTFNYIEVEMAPSAVPTKPVEGQVAGIPMMGGPVIMGGVVATPTITAPQPAEAEKEGTKTAAERLAELETLKKYITEEEYASKKADILSAV